MLIHYKRGRLKNIFQTALLIQSNQSFNFDN
uniref:Uncharacterized protein n=1 Tax=Neisseria meningitidis alpha153 TaxID=663926 RepID=C6SDG9_NEIME|nr:hypothetical protein predicted by Glimmer/Critica [Neisseria meningitidis alpha153]